jgi:glutamate---cysteine ligase / carboxylate-amine ligase
MDASTADEPTLDLPTLGVEEEFFIVDADTRELRPRAERILASAGTRLGNQVELEINLAQIETATAVCASLDDVAAQLGALRVGLQDAAAEHGSAVVATGTHPFSDWLGQQIAPKDRYLELEMDGQRIAWEQVICGCHVHVGIPDRDLAIRVLDRVRPWLPALRALTVNSPFWEGVDTGYASYRMAVFDRWPTTGIPPVLGSRSAYDALVADLHACGIIPDEKRLYWDVRPSSRFGTIEFRVADVCPTVEEAAALAALARALVLRVTPAAAEDAPFLDVPAPVLQGARWRAARYGLDGDLVDVEGRTLRPARDVVRSLLDVVRPALEAAGDLERVEEAVARLLAEGTGAVRQRRAFASAGLRGVVDAMIPAPAR